MSEIQNITAGDLQVAYYDLGPKDGPAAILLHGFPYDVRAYDQVTRHLNQQGIRTLVPYLRGYGPTRFLSDSTPRSGEQAALGSDLLAFMDALEISTAVVAGYDWGGRAACIVSALWPERVKGLVSCGAGYNIQNITAAENPLPPEEENRYWYMYYFHTERGRKALQDNRYGLCKYIWQLWSPSWAFDAQTYDQTAPSFDNPDFVEVVIHSYRHRFGGIAGDPQLAHIEQFLSRQPQITVPSIILQGEDDTVDPPRAKDIAKPHFTGNYTHRTLAGVGHNLPQEAPGDFSDAISELVFSD